MKTSKIFWLHAIFAVYCLSCLLVWRLMPGRLLNIAPTMIWNLFLALVAFDAVLLMIWFKNWLLKLVAAIIAFLFYPNTFYMITDAKHVGEWFPMGWVDFSSSTQTVAFILLLTGILFGTFLGMQSIWLAVRHFRLSRILESLFFAIMSFLSSVAIYAGRISTLRLNSWDIFTAPVATVKSLVAVISRPHAVFLISFTLYQLMMIALYRLFLLKEDRK